MVNDANDKDTKEKQVEEKIARREKRIEEPEMVSHKQSENIAFLSRRGLDVKGNYDNQERSSAIERL